MGVVTAAVIMIFIIVGCIFWDNRPCRHRRIITSEKGTTRCVQCGQIRGRKGWR